MLGYLVATLLVALTPLVTEPGSPTCHQDSKNARTQLCNLGIPFTEPAFVRSAAVGDTRVVSLFLDAGMDPNARDDFSFTALMEATNPIGNPGEKHVECIRLLLGRGAQVDARDKWGCTALTTAAYYGDPDVMRALIAGGADVNASGESGWTALMNAAEAGHLKAVKLLLDHGADQSARNDRGRTALSIAIGKHHRAVVALLRAANRNTQ